MRKTLYTIAAITLLLAIGIIIGAALARGNT